MTTNPDLPWTVVAAQRDEAIEILRSVTVLSHPIARRAAKFLARIAAMDAPAPPTDVSTREAALVRAALVLDDWYGHGKWPLRDMDSTLVSLARSAGWIKDETNEWLQLQRVAYDGSDRRKGERRTDTVASYHTPQSTRVQRRKADRRKPQSDAEPDGMLAYAMAIANPSRDDPNWPLPSFDAKDWAEAFCKIISDGREIDEDMMIGWFANALMRGYDEANMRATKIKSEPQPDADGWIAWDGKGKCPVPEGMKFAVRLRYGREFMVMDIHELQWDQPGYPSDIIAYRVVEGGEK